MLHQQVLSIENSQSSVDQSNNVKRGSILKHRRYADAAAIVSKEYPRGTKLEKILYMITLAGIIRKDGKPYSNSIISHIAKNLGLEGRNNRNSKPGTISSVNEGSGSEQAEINKAVAQLEKQKKAKQKTKKSVGQTAPTPVIPTVVTNTPGVVINCTSDDIFNLVESLDVDPAVRFKIAKDLISKVLTKNN